MTTKIFVATHKNATFYGTPCYQFIHVGHAMHPEVNIPIAIKDDECPDNISNRNDIYCELTAQYHIWKNVHDVDITGLVHYRRFLATKQYSLNHHKVVLTESEIKQLLKTHDIIIPTPTKKTSERNGYFKIKEDIPESCLIRLVRPFVKNTYPEYLPEFDAEWITPYAAFGNMLICKKKLFDKYSEWLFNILMQVEEFIKLSPLEVAPREMGYFSEYLLNIWIRHNNLKVAYVPMHFIDDSPKLTHVVRNVLQAYGMASIINFIDRLYYKHFHQ